MKKWVALLIVLTLAVGAFFIGRWTKPATVPADYSSLKEGVATLTAEKESFETQLTQANKAKENLGNEVTTLKNDKTLLEAQLVEADQVKADLTAEVNSLKAEITSLGAQSAECPICSVTTEPAKVPDTVQKFRDLAAFYIDGDQFIENWKVQGAQMSYTCQYDGPVYVSMDPGIINGQSTGDLGAVFHVACKKGDIVTLSTPHWSESALHQQVHVVEFTQEITAEQALNFLKVLKVDEGKPIAYFINSSGEVTNYQ